MVLSKSTNAYTRVEEFFYPTLKRTLELLKSGTPVIHPAITHFSFSTGRAGPTIWELRRICRRCAGAGVTDDRQYATAPHVCSITYRYAYTETYYMQFL